ncbi:MAG: hypothetical protein IJ335_09725 [Lachnospiraceae bacterium]|nr:hypothetical protein [Lachnospiraceae bacterium]
MADIKVVKSREKRQEDYRDKIFKYKLTNIYRFILLLLVFAAVIAIIAVQYRNHVYTGYTIVSTTSRQKGSGAVTMRLGNSVLTYSKDGSNCINQEGEVVWNQTFQMQDIDVAVSNHVSAISSYNGTQIYVQSDKESMGVIETTMPIRDVAVADNGRVTAVLADTDVAWLITYNKDGTVEFTGQAHMQNSGYPVAISLSPNGEKLAVSYIYLDAGTVKSHVAFYNFGDVGSNYSDYLISTYTHPEAVIPYIQFMNDTTSFAVGDDRLVFYIGSQKPVESQKHFYSEEIRSVYYNEEYVGLVVNSDLSEYRYRLDVFNSQGEKVNNFYFDMEYREVFFEKNSFVIYNESECLIMNMDGLEKFRGEFGGAVEMMLPTGKAYRYVLVTGSSLDTIQLN